MLFGATPAPTAAWPVCAYRGPLAGTPIRMRRHTAHLVVEYLICCPPSTRRVLSCRHASADKIAETSDRVSIAYWVMGDGRPLVYLPIQAVESALRAQFVSGRAARKLTRQPWRRRASTRARATSSARPDARRISIAIPRSTPAHNRAAVLSVARVVVMRRQAATTQAVGL